MNSIPTISGPALRAAALTILVTVLLSVAPASAQDPEPTRDEALSALFSTLPLQTDVRLVTMGGVVEEGQLTSVGSRGIDVDAGGETVPIGYDFVRSVSVESGHALQGTIWGASVGAVVGSLFGMMYASFDCRTAADCNYTETQGALRWGIFMSVVGGSTGFVFGRHSVHWHPIFP